MVFIVIAFSDDDDDDDDDGDVRGPSDLPRKKVTTDKNKPTKVAVSTDSAHSYNSISPVQHEIFAYSYLTLLLGTSFLQILGRFLFGI